MLFHQLRLFGIQAAIKEVIEPSKRLLARASVYSVTHRFAWCALCT
jgi:hypothetical protein